LELFEGSLEVPELALLNGFDVTYQGASLHVGGAGQRLLAFLALQERPVLRVYVAGRLWLDSTEDRALGSLRSALWSCRRHGVELVDARKSQIRLAAHVAVDLRKAEAYAHQLLDDTNEPDLWDLARIIGPCDLLPDWYDDWIVIERERFWQLRMHALDVVCERLTALGRYAEAVDAGLAAVREDPLRESAHRAVIKAHLAEGNRAEAIDDYRSFRARLRAELDIEPSPQIEVLLEDLM
jgi:DNA-binding SARP family transcriptional activator